MSRLRGLIILIGVALISWGAQRAPQDRAYLPHLPHPRRVLWPLRFMSIPRGPNRFPTGGSSARSSAFTSTRAITSGSSIVRERCSRTRRDRFWRAAPPVLEFDRRRQPRVVVGRARRRLRVAGPRARHLRRSRRQRVARRRRREGRADPEVHARGQVPAADRPQGAERRQQRHARISAAPPT